jgi:hypothetical protein
MSIALAAMMPRPRPSSASPRPGIELQLISSSEVQALVEFGYRRLHVDFGTRDEVGGRGLSSRLEPAARQGRACRGEPERGEGLQRRARLCLSLAVAVRG